MEIFLFGIGVALFGIFYAIREHSQSVVDAARVSRGLPTEAEALAAEKARFDAEMYRQADKEIALMALPETPLRGQKYFGTCGLCQRQTVIETSFKGQPHPCIDCLDLAWREHLARKAAAK